MNKTMGTSASFALLAIVLHMANSPRSERGSSAPQDVAGAALKAQGEAPAKSDSHSDVTIEGPWLATRAFFQADAPESGKPAASLNVEDIRHLEVYANNAEGRGEIADYFGVPQGYEVRSVIATVPDPLHTHLALLTDASLEAIQKATFDAGWQLATRWLPWYDAPDPTLKDSKKRRAQRADQREQERQPGLLVLRRDGGNELLFVFVAGETPTGGINGYQFRAGLAYMRALAMERDVHILGPTFSGSFFSLGQLIRRDRTSNPGDQYGHKYVVRSGTATNDAYALQLQQETWADFHGATDDATQQTLQFCQILDSLGMQSREAVSLVEGETGYAQGMSDEFKKSACPQGPEPRVLYFPREISHLRNVYRDTVAASKSQTQPQSAVDLSLKDGEAGEDSVPVFSSDQTPISQYAVLAEITTEIRREHIRLVRLVATNVLDLMFLTEVLRQQCPDARLLLTFPDLLFVQQAQKQPLTGTLAISSYPLFFASRPWLRQGQAFTHSDENSEGVYNAMRLLLNPNINASELSNYYWSSQNHPATWLMTLTRHGFSPVKVMPTASGWFEEANGSPRMRLSLPQPPFFWHLCVIAIGLISIWLTVSMIYPHFLPQVLRWQAVALGQHCAADACRLTCLFFVLCILLAMQGVLCLPLVSSSVKPLGAPDWITLSLAGVGCLCLLRALLEPIRRRLIRGITIVSTLAVLLSTAAVWIYCCTRGGLDKDGFFFSFRALEMEPGSSPVLPILAMLLGLLLITYFHLRCYDLATRQPAKPWMPLECTFRGHLKSCRRALERTLLAPVNLSPKLQVVAFLALFSTVFMAAILLHTPIVLSSLDGNTFEYLLMTPLLMLILAITCTCIQAAWAWRFLHGFLTIINWLPVSKAFTRLSNGSGKSPIWASNLRDCEIPMRAKTVLHNLHIQSLTQTERQEAELWKNTYESAIRALDLTQESNASASVSHSGLRPALTRYSSETVKVADAIYERILKREWERRSLAWKPDANAASASSDANVVAATQAEAGSQPDDDRYSLAQSFIALQLTPFILYAVRQIRNLFWAISAGFLLLAIGLNCYSYQAPQMIARFLIVAFVGLAYFGWRYLSRMERDPILSRIAGTTPGELNKNFYVRMGTYGALPALGLLASLFPSISTFVSSWVEPTLQVLK